MRNLILSCCCLALVAAPAFADGVSSVTGLVKEVCKSPSGKFILKDTRAPSSVTDTKQEAGECRFRIVFESRGKRYTLDNDWWIEGIQVWERPVGTTAIKDTDAYADTNYDGRVEFGTDGVDKIFAAHDYHHAGSPEKGREHAPHWNLRYLDALIGLEMIVAK